MSEEEIEINEKLNYIDDYLTDATASNDEAIECLIKVEEYINDLQQRIKKAVEYINHRVNVLGQVSMSEKDILSILKGEDK